jgi:hypothetical protein
MAGMQAPVITDELLTATDAARMALFDLTDDTAAAQGRR